MSKRKEKEKFSSIEFMSRKNLDQMSNLSSFLQSVTPIVRSKPLPKETSENFTLWDMWNCYEEWCAYGVGVPVTLNNNKSVKQYYVPYLSAIQIYTVQSPATLSFCRNLSEDNKSGDKNKLSTALNYNLSNANTKPMEYSKSRLGYLYFEYTEVCSLTWRIPLLDKITQLYQKYPGITKLKSAELSPASWMAINWCPILYIPLLELKRNVSTYFLTYHTISTLFQENTNDETKEGASLLKKKNGGIPLSPFGIASYKMESDVWMDKAQACIKYGDLHGAAKCWLKQLNFSHHDFNIFTSNARNLDHIYLY